MEKEQNQEFVNENNKKKQEDTEKISKKPFGFMNFLKIAINSKNIDNEKKENDVPIIRLNENKEENEEQWFFTLKII